MSTKIYRNFEKLLLSWYHKHGRFNLPWQQQITPYKVWISEIMLQQTQVATVIPYFERFMQRFPNTTALASAEEDAVLHIWTGLGYYRRAIHLHRASKIIVDQFQGIFPTDLITIKSLPGIGPSTAAAIMALAFDQPAAILDGNVKRVLTRLFSITDPINHPAIEKKMYELAEKLASSKFPRFYTQAIMDLGATICTYKNPQCQKCPAKTLCASANTTMASQLPIKTKKLKPRKQATFLVFKNGAELLLLKRPASGVWQNLWSFPEAPAHLSDEELQQQAQIHGLKLIKNIEKLKVFTHTFTHFHLEIQPVLMNVRSKSHRLMATQEKIWYNPKKPQKVGLPKPILTIMEALR